MIKFTTSGFTVVLVSLAACMVAGCPPKPPTPSPCTKPDVGEASLVVRMNPASNPALANAFPLRKTLEAIASGAAVPTTPENLLQSMLDSFEKSSFVHPEGGRSLPVDVRQPEADLQVADLLDPATGMVPVGLFNRLDLAPKDGSDCGEYRIVYAKVSGAGKFFIIFESKLPNPVAGSGIAGCQPVAKFWADLSPLSPAERVSRLETFYYQGLPGTSFEAVVKFENFGMPLGQVRTNLFVLPRWTLREHRVGVDSSDRAVFVVDTVKESPVAQLYSDAVPSGFTAAEQEQFLTHFLKEPVCNLVRPDRVMPSPGPRDIVNGIGGGFAEAWNDFESISQGSVDEPAAIASAALPGRIDARLAELGVNGITSEHLLNRAGAMTCGGCHQFSSGDSLGGGSSNVWPSDAGFVHITESGDISQALGVFLESRERNLERFVCDPTPAPKPEADCPDPIGGAISAAGTGIPRTAVARALNAPADAALLERLNQDRPAPIYREFDRLRAEYSAAVRSAAGRRTAEVRSAKGALEEAVQKARAADAAKEGAFVPVRRVH